MKGECMFPEVVVIMVAAVFLTLVFLSFPAASFSPSKYDDLLNRLSGKRFMVVHDCDFKVEGISRLLAVERAHNVSAVYFLRPDADYFTQNIAWFQELEAEGVTFGFHYDCLSRTNGSYGIARDLFRAELLFMRSFLNISYSRAHGDNYNLKINNHDLYDVELWRSLNLTDLSNEMPFHVGYVADTNHVWQENLTEPILVNLHSDYW